MTHIQRAARLARLRSSSPSAVPFADALHILGQRITHLKKIEKPIVFVPHSSPTHVLCDGQNNKFLFLADEIPARFQSIKVVSSYDTEHTTIQLIQQAPEGSRAASFRSLFAHLLDDPTAQSLLAHVMVTVDFRRNSRFCSRCGAQRLHPKRCDGCGQEKYPRFSPCAIVLVHDVHTDSVLLGKRPGGNIWSLLAGFCEPLESMENCAVREVMEESGVALDRSSVDIAVTQPWPFFGDKFEGTSLMMGCYAETASSGQVPSPQVEELDAVKWVSVNDLHAMLDRNTNKVEQTLPITASMAQYLIRAFLDSR